MFRSTFCGVIAHPSRRPSQKTRLYASTTPPTAYSKSGRGSTPSHQAAVVTRNTPRHAPKRSETSQRAPSGGSFMAVECLVLSA